METCSAQKTVTQNPRRLIWYSASTRARNSLNSNWTKTEITLRNYAQVSPLDPITMIAARSNDDEQDANNEL